ncbi:Short-chain dehydrogenase/reductase SDR [Crenothrix polyspora]|uniref:Short-chain dehydrogenase/reductase SDR n=1 Tax=Crenothrix polyspora TaxID=360316 RepID=A0A1R4H6B1_9GAMM|nr:SDR family oxidoreductase [Crenothrix polyspora]SJM91818.1 Short-chain dehydrogenase/reductase SDR [Crenothrix polyspora]
MSTVLITGANRGLGLEFCRQYAADNWTVVACCRDVSQATALQQLARQYSNIQLETLDITDFSQIDGLSRKLSLLAIDVLINNAGVYGDEGNHRFGHLDYQAWLDTLLINTQAPVKMAETFLGHVKCSQEKLIVTVSSLMGSLADNTSGGSILYRSSKAAVNAAMKSLAIDLKKDGIGVLIFHPGWVKTDMGGANAPTLPAESIAGMRQVIAGFSLDQSGDFVRYDGEVMPW